MPIVEVVPDVRLFYRLFGPYRAPHKVLMINGTCRYIGSFTSMSLMSMSMSLDVPGLAAPGDNFIHNVCSLELCRSTSGD